MATAAQRTILSVILITNTVWIWSLAGILFAIRWHAIVRPAPPTYEIFPYGEIRIGVDASYPPFAVATANDLFGFEIDLGLNLGAELGLPVRFVNMGFDGLYDAIKADQVDMVISTLLIDSSRTNDVRYSKAYFNNGLMLISPRNNPISTLENTTALRLAFEYGSTAHEEANRWARRITYFVPMPYELPHYALDAVQLGYADVAIVDATSYLLYKRDTDWEGHAVYLTDALYAIAVRIDREDKLRAINRALSGLSERGLLDTIMARWF